MQDTLWMQRKERRDGTLDEPSLWLLRSLCSPVTHYPIHSLSHTVHSIGTHFVFLLFLQLFFLSQSYMYALFFLLSLLFFKAPERSSWNGALKGYYIGYKISDSRDQYLYKTIDKQSSSFLMDQHSRKKQNSLMLNLTNVSSSSGSGVTDPQRPPEQHHHSSSDTRVTLKGLKPLTEYIILVQAYNSFGAGPQSDGLLIKTTEDGKSERREQKRATPK